jgi:hypothetical protein
MSNQPLTIRAARSGLALLAEHHGVTVAAIALTSRRIEADASPAGARAVPALRRLAP